MVYDVVYQSLTNATVSVHFQFFLQPCEDVRGAARGAEEGLHPRAQRRLAPGPLAGPLRAGRGGPLRGLADGLLRKLNHLGVLKLTKTN